MNMIKQEARKKQEIVFRFATLHSKGGQKHHLSDFLKNLHTFIDKAA